VKIDKLKDLVERVGWTFIQAEIALGALDWIASGINLNLLHQLYISLGTAAAATVKVLIAQQFGGRGSGDAIPGGIEASPVPVPSPVVPPVKAPAKPAKQ